MQETSSPHPSPSRDPLREALKRIAEVSLPGEKGAFRLSGSDAQGFIRIARNALQKHPEAEPTSRSDPNDPMKAFAQDVQKAMEGPAPGTPGPSILDSLILDFFDMKEAAEAAGSALSDLTESLSLDQGQIQNRLLAFLQVRGMIPAFRTYLLFLEQHEPQDP